jgi:ubiquinol-cytochrome c reductase cytochrome b subunit
MTSKDAITWTVTVLVFVIVVLRFPHMLGRAENFMVADPLRTPAHITPE